MTATNARNTILITSILLLAIGIVTVYSASGTRSYLSNGDQTSIARFHLLYVTVALAGMVGFSLLNYELLKKGMMPMLAATFLFLVAVQIPGVGREINDAHRWIRIGEFSFQPSEMAKYTLVIFIAAFAAKRPGIMGDFKRGLLPAMLVTAAAAGVTMAQRDHGTPLFIMGVCTLVMLAAGARLRHFAPFAALACLALVVVLGIGIFKNNWSHVPSRIRDYWYSVSHGTPADPMGTGYQVEQSLRGLGAGGFWGKGLGLGRQKLGFLPEQHTDFIFAVLGEEFGFMGTSVVTGLFALLAFAGLKIAQLARSDPFASLLAFSITMIIALQAIFNIAVVTNMVPTKGIGLPFISKGGSAILFQCFAIGILVNIANRFLAMEQGAIKGNPLMTDVDSFTKEKVLCEK